MASLGGFVLVLAAAAALATCDPATALGPCGGEQPCPDTGVDLWDRSDGTAEAPGWKCSLCVKVLQWAQKEAGDDPDEDAVQDALAKACQALGKRLGRACRRALRKYGAQLAEALQNGDEPRVACAAARVCKQ